MQHQLSPMDGTGIAAISESNVYIRISQLSTDTERGISAAPLKLNRTLGTVFKNHLSVISIFSKYHIVFT